jgi:hypothetical protein
MASNPSGRFAFLLTAECRSALTGTRIPKTLIWRRSGRLSTPTRSSPSSKRPNYANREGKRARPGLGQRGSGPDNPRVQIMDRSRITARGAGRPSPSSRPRVKISTRS